jgi:cytosine/adenosine deaminase-related metal-dependent hydrolase
MDRLLVRGATVLTMDPTLGDLVGDVLVEGSRIARVGPDLSDATAAEGVEVIDAAGAVAIPGMVDGHRHMWQGALGGVAANFCLNDYFGTVLGTLSPRFQPEDVYAGTLFSSVRALDSGVTTCLDWSHIVLSPDHADEGVRAHRRSGARTVYCYGFPVGLSVADWVFNSTLTHPTDAARMRREMLSSDAADELITMGLALRGPGMAHPDTTEHDIRFGRELGLRTLSMHAGEPEYHLANQTVKVLRDRGLMGPDLHFAHGNQFDAEDLRIVVGEGAHLTATPMVELEMGLGYPMVIDLVRAGGTPSLGVDTITGTGHDLFTQMRITMSVERARAAQPVIDDGRSVAGVEFGPRDYLRWATLGGAEALGMAGSIGSITPGKQADLVLLRPRGPLNDPATTVVMAMDTSNVDTVIVGGRLLKRDGRMLGDVAAEAEDAVAKSRDRLFAGLGLDATLGPAWA